MIIEADIAPGHIDHALECCRRFHAMSPWKDVPFSPEKLSETLRSLIESDQGVVLMHPTGVLLGAVSELPFSSERVAMEMAWWAQEDGLSLLKAFEEWAQGKARFIMLSSLYYMDQDNERYDRLFRKAGYTPKESQWVKELS